MSYPNGRSSMLTPSRKLQDPDEPIVIPKTRSSRLPMNSATSQGASTAKISFGGLPNFTSFVEQRQGYRQQSQQSQRQSSVHTLNISSARDFEDDDVPPLRSQEDANFELVNLSRHRGEELNRLETKQYHNYNTFNGENTTDRNYTFGSRNTALPVPFNLRSRKSSGTTTIHRDTNVSKILQHSDDQDSNQVTQQEQLTPSDIAKRTASLLLQTIALILTIVYKLISSFFVTSEDQQQEQQQEQNNESRLVQQAQDDNSTYSHITTPLARKGAPPASNFEENNQSFSVSSLNWETRQKLDELEHIREGLLHQGQQSGDYGTHFIIDEDDNEKNGQSDVVEEPNVELEYIRKIFNNDGRFELQLNDNYLESQDYQRKQSYNISSALNLSQKLRSAIGLGTESEDSDVDNSDIKIIDEKPGRGYYVSQFDIARDDALNKASLLLFEEEFKTYQSIVEEKRRRQELIKDLKIQKEQISAVPKLSADQIAYVRKFMYSPNVQEVVKKNLNGVELKVHDLQTLSGTNWLNDNVIDAYLSLITKRSSANPSSLSSSFVFTTHFYSTLASKGYSAVQRWAKRKKIDVTKLDYIFVPVNSMNTHWSLACVNNKAKKFQYYDSLSYEGSSGSRNDFERSKNMAILNNLVEYMEGEDARLHNGSSTVDFQSYQMLPLIKSPQQKNGSDCGVFTCTAVEFLSRDKFLQFGQADMENLRYKMCYELLTEQLMK